jgi:hypothetical protein
MRAMTVQIAATAAAALLGLVALFQLLLAGGLKLGEATMGGRARVIDGALAPRYRVAALASAVLLVVAVLIVLSRAGVVVIGAWVVVGFTILNTLTNLSGRHPLERFGLSAVTVVVAILTAYVALSAA